MTSKLFLFGVLIIETNGTHHHHNVVKKRGWLMLPSLSKSPSVVRKKNQPIFLRYRGGDFEDEEDDENVESSLMASGILEHNPDYVKPNENTSEEEEDDEDDTDDEEYDSDYESDDDDEEEGLKSKLSKALSKSRRKKAMSKSLKLWKKHQGLITFGLVLLAFRREIMMGISSLFPQPDKDGKKTITTSRWRSMLPSRIHPTSILKLILFLQIMRRLQQISSSDDEEESSSNPSSSLTTLLLALRLGGPFPLFLQGLRAILSFRPSNPAYVPPIEQHYTFERVNERYFKDSMSWKKAKRVVDEWSLYHGGLGGLGAEHEEEEEVEGWEEWKNRSRKDRQEMKKKYENGTAIILDLASTPLDVNVLRDQVSFILTEYHKNQLRFIEKKKREEDLNSTATNSTTITTTTTTTPPPPPLEVIILLESPGGAVSDFGLASDQIRRLRTASSSTTQQQQQQLTVTICVDKIAASGGYMMACHSTPGHLYAAPFALLGSIGVIGQIFNVHDLLKNWGVRPLVFRAGKDKASLGSVGEEVTEGGKERVQEMLDEVHGAFRKLVVKARPGLEEGVLLGGGDDGDGAADLGSGNVYLGVDAVEVGLIDRVVTSDEYIMERILKDDVRVLKLIPYSKGRFFFGGAGRNRVKHSSFGAISASGDDVSSLLGHGATGNGLNDMNQLPLYKWISSATRQYQSFRNLLSNIFDFF